MNDNNRALKKELIQDYYNVWIDFCMFGLIFLYGTAFFAVMR